MKHHDKIVFKPYEMNQPMLLPPDINEMIPDNHLVRLVSSVIESMDIEPLLKPYKGGGRSSYHPKMLLKVIIYAYTQKIYSSRMIAKALRENIYMMWISGKSQPDFRTISRFRASRLKEAMDNVFAFVVQTLMKHQLVNLKDYFMDGTKIEASANKYTFVWSKSTKRFKGRIPSKIRELLEQIDKCDEQEQKEYGNRDLEEMGEDSNITSEDIEKIVEELNDRLKEEPDNKEVKKAEKTISTDLLPRMKKYEVYERIAAGRNSFSKTDHDAIFMRMKDDHMRNGQLKPGYNVQIGTENQFITCYSIHQNAGDSTLLKPHLEKFKELHGRFPETVIADAGYGSEENYNFLENEKIEGYVKFNKFHYEQKARFKKKIFSMENMPYDSEQDEFTCPAGKKLKYAFNSERKTKTGYVSKIKNYECTDCSACEMKPECTRSKYNRRIGISKKLEIFKQDARTKLTSKDGREYRSRRPIEVESVFGHIKANRGFTRFLLRGLEKVTIEWGLLSLAHNFKKMQTILEA